MSLVTRLTGVFLVAAAAFLLPSHAAQAATANVAVSGTIGQTWFCSIAYQGGVCPTTVSVGDTVQWNFSGDIYSAHSTRHCSDGCDATPSGTPLWDSPTATVQTHSYTFNSPGVYPYQCEVHPLLMQGEITVVAGVGGVAELPDIDASPAKSTDASGNSTVLLAGIAAGAVSVLALGGAAWYARRRIRARSSRLSR